MTFYELAGEGAEAQLGAFARVLGESGLETELLESQTQAGLFLLVCYTGDAPQVTVPKGAKVWQFRRVGS